MLFHHDLSLKTLSVCKDSIKKRKSHSLRLQTAAFIIFYPKHTFLPYDFLVAHNINVSFLWHKDFSSREVEQSRIDVFCYHERWCICHQEKKSWDIIRKCFITKINVSKSAFLKFYLYFCSVIQNFVLFLQHDNKQNVWIWQASRCTNRVA